MSASFQREHIANPSLTSITKSTSMNLKEINTVPTVQGNDLFIKKKVDLG